MLGVAFGVGAARWAAQPESRGGGVAGLLGHREGEHPAGVVVAPDLLAGLRRAGESVLGGALVAQPGVGAGFYGGESDPGGTGLGNVVPAVDGEFDGGARPVVPVSDQALGAPDPGAQRVVTRQLRTQERGAGLGLRGLQPAQVEGSVGQYSAQRTGHEVELTALLGVLAAFRSSNSRFRSASAQLSWKREIALIRAVESSIHGMGRLHRAHFGPYATRWTFSADSSCVARYVECRLSIALPTSLTAVRISFCIAVRVSVWWISLSTSSSNRYWMYSTLCIVDGLSAILSPSLSSRFNRTFIV